MEVGRYSFAIAEIGNKLYVTGGITKGDKYLNSVEAFNFAS